MCYFNTCCEYFICFSFTSFLSRHVPFWCGWIITKTEKHGFVFLFSFSITSITFLSLFLDTFHEDVDTLSERQKEMGLYFNLHFPQLHCCNFDSKVYLVLHPSLSRLVSCGCGSIIRTVWIDRYFIHFILYSFHKMYW